MTRVPPAVTNAKRGGSGRRRGEGEPRRGDKALRLVVCVPDAISAGAAAKLC